MRKPYRKRQVLSLGLLVSLAGSGNVMCLDVLRAVEREGEAARAVLAGLADETAGLPGARDAAAFIEAT